MGATSVVGDAEVALARAHAADGDRLAPYETTLADLYLVKAREEQGYANYAEARALATDSARLAEVAAKKAAERRTQGAAPTAPPATIEHAPAPASAPPAQVTPPAAAPPATTTAPPAAPAVTAPPASAPPPAPPKDDRP